MEYNKVQNFLVEINAISLLEKYLELAIPTVLSSNEELAVKVIDRKEKYLSLHLPSVVSDQERYFPVMFVGGWYAPKNGKSNSYFNGYPKWKTFNEIEETIKYVLKVLKERKSSWDNQFIKKFGEGYSDFFNRRDGSVEVGFKIQSAYCCPEYLIISLIHFYYGK